MSNSSIKNAGGENVTLVAMHSMKNLSRHGLRLPPSAVNSQPWYFTHEGKTIHVHCSRKGSQLDAGIALAHLYVANEHEFRFFKAEHMADLPGYRFTGSIEI